MFLLRADPEQGQVGGGWALEGEIFLGPVKWHRADRWGWGGKTDLNVTKKEIGKKLKELNIYFWHLKGSDQ